MALRYPRGQAYEGLKEYHQKIVPGKSEKIYDESQIALFAVGSMVETAVEVHDILKEKGYDCTLVNVRFVKPMDEEMLCAAAREHLLLVTMEENVLMGGYGMSVLDLLNRRGIDTKVLNIGIDDRFVEHGSVGELKQMLGIDAVSAAKRIIDAYESI